MFKELYPSKRTKLDLNNNYHFNTMESTSDVTLKPIAATLTEFLEQPSKFRPSNEFINLTLPDVSPIFYTFKWL